MLAKHGRYNLQQVDHWEREAEIGTALFQTSCGMGHCGGGPGPNTFDNLSNPRDRNMKLSRQRIFADVKSPIAGADKAMRALVQDASKSAAA